MNLLNYYRQLSALILVGVLSFVSVGVTAAEVSGNSNGNIVVEEFFDYQCPHCRIMLENTDKLAKNNRDVKLVTRVVPLMGPNSWTIARATLAARKQGKFAALHHLLMQERQYISDQRLLSLAEMAGINMAQLQRDMRSKSISAELNANISTSRRRGVEIISATFVYRANNHSSQIRIVGDKSYGELQQSISNL